MLKDSARAKIAELVERYPVLAVCERDILRALTAIVGCFASGGKLMTCGNGGSASDAQHIVGELMKGFVKKRRLSPDFLSEMRKICPGEADYLYQNLQGTLPAISLVGETALATAFSNDQAADLAMAQEVIGIGRRGDVLLAISTSGNSKNVIYAACVARMKKISVIALTGRDGGRLAAYADIAIRAPEDETYKVQELHLPIYHAISIAAEDEYFDS